MTQTSEVFSIQDGTASRSADYKTSRSSGAGTASIAGLTGIMVANSMEFSYQERAKATNNFSLDNKIGQGGFGVVYYAELRGGEYYAMLIMRRRNTVLLDALSWKIPLVSDIPTIIFGVNVTHPESGEDICPSIVAVSISILL
ncbi:hypothetical protein RJT34_16104 [Clitoria ternatea]|uniref:Protein kinase domain-containing protein n=1 Tax=Clitoria ternatea TaxID=43366 RepID=A0AAN9PCL3_CLITE